MRDVLRTTARLLTFRSSREELLALDRRHLAFGLACTWLVGMGRDWDDPDAHLLQHLGLGSLIYVLALSAFLFLLLWPLGPKDWSWRRLLTFVTLVAPPAALYAIPVERFVPLDAARAMNAWFLAVVATWRVALLFFFLWQVAGFRAGLWVAGVLPLAAIVNVLLALNLERATFHIMGGFGSSPNDGAYEVLFVITIISEVMLVPLLSGYLIMALMAWDKRKEERAARAGGTE